MVFGLYDVQTCFVVREGVSVNRCLRNKSIRHRQPNDASYKSGATEEEEVPMKSSRLLEWELASLSGQAANILRCVSLSCDSSCSRDIGTYMIVIEQEHSKKTKRQ